MINYNGFPTWQAKIDLMYFSCILYFFSFQVTQTASSSPDPLFYEHSLIQSLECYSLFPCSWYLAGPCLLFFGWLLYTCFLTMSLVLFMFCLFGRKYCKPYPELHFNITNATPVQYHYLLSWSINCTLRMCFMIYMSNMCTFMMFKHLMKLLLFLVQDDCNNLCFRCW